MYDKRKLLETARDYIHLEADAVRAVASQIDDSFVDVAHRIMDVRGKVVVTGAGTSGTIARRFAHLLNVTGTPAFFLSPVDALHGSLGAITEDDLLIAISKGGESAELTDMTARARQRGAHTIALTSMGVTSLGSVADEVVVVDSPDADLGGIIAMGSTLAHAAWGDALCMTLMDLKQYGWDRVLHSHPRGGVGKKGVTVVL